MLKTKPRVFAASVASALTRIIVYLNRRHHVIKIRLEILAAHLERLAERAAAGKKAKRTFVAERIRAFIATKGVTPPVVVLR